MHLTTLKPTDELEVFYGRMKTVHRYGESCTHTDMPPQTLREAVCVCLFFAGERPHPIASIVCVSNQGRRGTEKSK